MKAPAGSLIQNFTLEAARNLINETNVRYCVYSSKNGIELLSVVLEETEYLVAIENQCLMFILQVDIPMAGNFDLASNWNVFETVGTVVCLNNGYLMKFGVLISGGVVKETLRDAVVEFNSQALKFLSRVQQTTHR